MVIALVIPTIIQFLNAKIIGKNFKSFKDNNTKNSNNYKIKNIMTNYEKYFYDILIELEDELSVRIHPQVNLATILNKETNSYYINELFRNIDFGIFTKDYSELLLLIEINDSTHNSKDRRKRDKKVDNILKNANVKLIKFYSSYPNKKEYVKEKIKSEIFGNKNNGINQMK